MALISIAQPPPPQKKGGLLSKLGGSVGGIVGTGLGAALAVPTGGLSIAGGAALGGALGGALGNTAAALDTPGSNKLASVAGGASSALNGLVQAKDALKNSTLPAEQYHAYDNHLNTAINELNQRLNISAPSMQSPTLTPAGQFYGQSPKLKVGY